MGYIYIYQRKTSFSFSYIIKQKINGVLIFTGFEKKILIYINPMIFTSIKN